MAERGGREDYNCPGLFSSSGTESFFFISL